MSVIVRPGLVSDAEAVQRVANEPKTIPFLGNWMMLQQLRDMYDRGNRGTPFNVVLEVDGEIVGFSSSRSPEDHYHEFGEVAVKASHRRNRYGTAMYTYHILRCMLSGRFLAKDQTLDINETMQKGFLPFIGFRHGVILRNRVRNFASLNWWLLDLHKEVLWRLLDAIPQDIEFQGLSERRRDLDNHYQKVHSQLSQIRTDLLWLIEDNRAEALEVCQERGW